MGKVGQDVAARWGKPRERGRPAYILKGGKDHTQRASENKGREPKPSKSIMDKSLTVDQEGKHKEVGGQTSNSLSQDLLRRLSERAYRVEKGISH